MCHLLLKRVVWILFVSLLISLWTLIHSFVYVQLENVLWTCVSPFASSSSFANFLCCLKRNSSIGYPLTSWVGPYVKPFFFFLFIDCTAMAKVALWRLINSILIHWHFCPFFFVCLFFFFFGSCIRVQCECVCMFVYCFSLFLPLYLPAFFFKEKKKSSLLKYYQS